MKLHELSPSEGSKKEKRRIGRGPGSGFGKTSGRGTKGQKSRSGSRGGTRPGFEGGQMPLQRTVRKRGFVNIFATNYACVNVQDLNRFEEGAVVDAASLKEIGLVRKPLDGIKILGNGELDRKLTVKATAFSGAAKEKIEQAGGKAEVI